MIADVYIGPYVKELHHPSQGYIFISYQVKDFCLVAIK